MIPTLIRAYEAGAAIGPYKIAKFSDAAASTKIGPATLSSRMGLRV